MKQCPYCNANGDSGCVVTEPLLQSWVAVFQCGGCEAKGPPVECETEDEAMGAAMNAWNSRYQTGAQA